MFTPSTRGSLTELEKGKPSQFAAIAPESPRPPEMLSRVTVCKRADLTPLDQATHEIMLSQAFEIDPSMQQEVYAISLKALTRYLGRDVRKQDVTKSIERLGDIKVNFVSAEDERRSYRSVRLIDMWEEHFDDNLTIEYSFPFPIRQLMRSMPRYAHLELAVLGDGLMSTKWSPALYKHLLLASKAKEWQPGESNEIFVQMTPDEVVDAVDFPRIDGKYNPTKLTEFVIKTVADLKRVRRFQTLFDPKSDEDIVRETGRGRRIRYYNFRLRLNPPRPEFLRGGMIAAPGIGAKDAPEYQVSSGVWEKANRLYDRRSAFCGFMPNTYRDLWLTALHEAIEGKPLSDGYDTQMYRGKSLLAAIQQRGADYAAWLFLGEEDHTPDLIELVTKERRLAAHVARADRVGQTGKRLRKFHKWEAEAVAAEAAKPVLDPNDQFNNCKKAALVLHEMTADAFEAEVETPLYEMEWSGDRQFILSITSGSRHATFRVRPTAEQWQQILRNYYGFMSEGISYE